MSPSSAREAYLAWHHGSLSPTGQAELAQAIVDSPEISTAIRDELRFDTDLALAVRGLVASGLVQRVAGVQRTLGSQRRRHIAQSVWRRAERPRRWWLRPSVMGSLAAVLVLALGILAWLTPTRIGILELPRTGWEREGEVVRITKPTVLLHGPAGLEVELRLGTTIAAEPNQDVLALRQGFARVAAPHRPPGDPLRFVTPHLSADVVGTRFTLECGSGTTLRVSEGTVVAHRLSSAKDPSLRAIGDAASGMPVTAGGSLRNGVVGEWDFSWDSQAMIRTPGAQLIPATETVRGHVLGAALQTRVQTLNLTLPTSEIINWAAVTAVDMEFEASGNMHVLILGWSPTANAMFAAKHVMQATENWQQVHLPTGAFHSDMPADAVITKMIITAESNQPLRLGRIAFLAAPANPPP